MPEIQEMTGFQSPCAEYAEDSLSLDKKFLTNPPAMFLIRVKSDSKLFMLRKGDLLLVNRALTPKHGDYVVAVISNEFVIARFQILEKVPTLYPFNKKVGEDELGEDYVWGVAASWHRELRA